MPDFGSADLTRSDLSQDFSSAGGIQLFGKLLGGGFGLVDAGGYSAFDVFSAFDARDERIGDGLPQKYRRDRRAFGICRGQVL